MCVCTRVRMLLTNKKYYFLSTPEAIYKLNFNINFSVNSQHSNKYIILFTGHKYCNKHYIQIH